MPIRRSPIEHLRAGSPDGAHLLELVLLQPVEGGLEVVEDDGISQTLEDESQLPERVEAVGEAGAGEDVGHAQDVADDECDGEDHGAEQDAETWRYADQLDDRKVVSALDVPEEGDAGEDPPGITAWLSVIVDC